MNKKIFTLAILFSISSAAVAETAPAPTVNRAVDATLAGAANATQYVTGSTILDTLIPSRKNCDYVNKKEYQPFSGIDSTFPGASTLGMTEGRKGETCISVTGGTENLVKLLFTTAISIIIILTVISISVAGIQYMTEQATGQIKGGAKKRLKDSLIALALALLSYTILYTVNRQLVSFDFAPGSIDQTGAIDRGIADANLAASSSGAVTALVDAARPVVTNGYGAATPSPTGFVNRLTGAPCVPFVGPAAPGAPADPCVKQDSLLGAYGTGGLGFGGAGTPQAPGTDIQARFTTINSTALGASADGSLSLNGVSYPFRSGGGGNGYLPPGTYTVSNGYLRNDPISMTVDGFGYSFDLSDSYDPRTSLQRSLLRIHPDGGGPGTAGCIGIQGPRSTQEQFYSSLKALLAANGGKYTVRVGM